MILAPQIASINRFQYLPEPLQQPDDCRSIGGPHRARLRRPTLRSRRDLPRSDRGAFLRLRIYTYFAPDRLRPRAQKTRFSGTAWSTREGSNKLSLVVPGARIDEMDLHG